MAAYDTSILARARRKLSRYPGLRCRFGRLSLAIEAPSPDGFPIHLHVRPRSFSVSLGGWRRRFDRDDDALECVEFGLSSSCRLMVEYRGSIACAWTVEARQYGVWQRHHRTARWLSPFWLKPRVVYRQNRVEGG